MGSFEEMPDGTAPRHDDGLQRRVAHVQWSGALGGIGRLVHDLATEQAGRGRTVSVVFGQADGPFANAARRSGLPVVDLGLRSGFDLHPRRIVTAIRRLRHVDVMHVHALNLPLALIVLAARRPLVVTEHGTFALGRRRDIWDLLKRRIARRVLSRPHTSVVGNSRHTVARMCQIYRLDRRSVSVIHNGTRFAPLVSRSQGPVTPELAIAFVGRLVSFKHVDRLIRGAACACERDRIRILIIGSGPLEAPLRELAAQLDMTDRVSFLGYREDVDALLDTCDVLVHPSRHEPFGLAIVEACGRGLLPIVFADAGGALEVLPPGGRVVASVAELGAVLDQLIASPALASGARSDRAAWARNTFSVGRMADAYDEIYARRLLAAKRQLPCRRSRRPARG